MGLFGNKQQQDPVAIAEAQRLLEQHPVLRILPRQRDRLVSCPLQAIPPNHRPVVAEGSAGIRRWDELV